MRLFAQRMRIARARAKKTQQDVAKQVRVHRVTITRLESGKAKRLDFKLGCAIAQCLAVNAMWLAGMSEDMRPGVHFETEAEWQNFDAYSKMSKPEREDLIEAMTDFHRARAIVGTAGPKLKRTT